MRGGGVALSSNQYFGFYSKAGWVAVTPGVRPDHFPPDMDYWSKVLEEIDLQAPDLGLRIVVTWDWRSVEIEGSDVVVVNLGAEPPFRPMYVKRVLATFRSVAWKPIETVSGMTRFDSMALSAVLKYLYNLKRHLQGERRIVGDLRGHCFDVPLGVWKWEDAEPKPMAERSIDLVFLGSIDVKNDVSSLRNRLAPKTQGRDDMVRNVERLQSKRPDLTIQMGFADGFGKDVPGMAKSYTETLADTRLGLHPIGRNPESFRFFELVRMGSIPVSHLLPARDHYEGNPAVFMDRFDKLERTIDALYADPVALQKRSDDCLAYYDRMISPAAIARRMVEKIRSVRSR